MSEDKNAVLQENLNSAEDKLGLTYASKNDPGFQERQRLPTRTTHVSTKTLLARIASLSAAVAISAFVLVTKRYDIEDFVSVFQMSPQLRPWDSTIAHGTPAKDYALCTRSRQGIYTVDDRVTAGKEQSSTTGVQCLVVNAFGLIAETGSIGAYIYFVCTFPNIHM
jgi:hypothetical protein